MSKNNIQDIWLSKAKSIGEIKDGISYLAIGAHSDDLELIGLAGIIKHFKNKRNNFFGVLVSDNRGKPFHPKYKDYSPSRIQKIREDEQIKAAKIGDYSGVAFLRYPSSLIKNPSYKKEIEDKIKEIIELLNPHTIYTHNLYDRHPTHVAVSLRVIGALRKITKTKRPKEVYGVEVWGSLDWLSDKEKIAFDVSGYEELLSKLLEVFKSQIYKSHRYNEAALCRMRSNAIYNETHQFSKSTSLIFALDLMPLIKNRKLSIKKFIKDHLRSVEKDLPIKQLC